MKTTSYTIAAMTLSLAVGSALLTAPVQAGCNNFSSVHAENSSADTRCTAAVGITTVNDRKVKDTDFKDEDEKTWGDVAKEFGKRLEKDLEEKQ